MKWRRQSVQYLQQAWQLQTWGMRGNQKSILLNINHTFRYQRKSTVSALHSPHNTQRFNSLHSACLPNPPDAPYKTWADGGKQVRSGQPPPDSWHGVNVPATRVQVLLLARSGAEKQCGVLCRPTFPLAASQCPLETVCFCAQQTLFVRP